MLLVKTYIAPSKIHGIGLFATEFIKKGTPTWQFTPGMDLELKENLMKLPQSSWESLLNHCYIDPQKPDTYILCFDNARFVNHSENPSIKNGPLVNGVYSDIAARDIEEGEELTYNYKEEDLDYYRKFNLNQKQNTKSATL